MTTFIEARGAKAERERRERRHYKATDLGRACLCGIALPKALIAAGIHAHPTCGPDVADLMATS